MSVLPFQIYITSSHIHPGQFCPIQGGDPARVGVAMTDLSTGLYAHGAILAALLQRYRTGRGQRIECSLLSSQVGSCSTHEVVSQTSSTCEIVWPTSGCPTLDNTVWYYNIYINLCKSLLLISCCVSQVALMSHLAANYLTIGMEAQRQGTAHPSIAPYQVHKSVSSSITVQITVSVSWTCLASNIALWLWQSCDIKMILIYHRLDTKHTELHIPNFIIPWITNTLHTIDVDSAL